ncbi:hypothetical protein PHYBLDRAFT_71969 [Phycomyces blakesleeanus NRRL 1555(-)]|uniref:Uncharacterized protein n=1 Tax=Phycomyces blakesleeanus (strain ATCC 8743b / DSM 1359 / FGSC 10004 / NBRC 33097 / NRRL 1555) TaxID=763407 RepID=A0A162NLA2_PHYB8|nr:hypothetical protein PHYBLDRAFT_71969 [Phycomyces blakesleeanus NRRL 1555(-)]OAD75268.1 hypothetical protein PHYBLDRAFT_71969 [Phycomyces blakesleeanus NRRL 1555(-)]|eukprot:XP_018293308.1 hypothetical protein PHYBLDRAFT_71969 [Phycomyces blakesleeanus NRRL 1555(-)]
MFCLFLSQFFTPKQPSPQNPKANGNTYPKAPTLLLYDKIDTTVIAWGYDAQRKALLPGCKGILVDRFKLCLDPEIRDSIILLNGLTSVKVISDYLRLFHKYILSELNSTLGAVYDPTRFKYSLTVPAAWDDSAKAIMRRAAIQAGIISQSNHPSRLVLTGEPEAASLFCDKQSKQFKLGSGDRFMICDAGGGTVGLIVFEHSQDRSTMTLKEITKGSGKSCGSTFLDLNMRNILMSRLGHHANENKAAIDNLIKYFVTTAKPEFEDGEDAYFPLPQLMNISASELAAMDVVDGSLHIAMEELREKVFDPVVEQVFELISGQLRKALNISTIFLVGGFGQSKYLLKRIKEKFVSKVVSIAAPNRGEMAVTRGAVLYGLNSADCTTHVRYMHRRDIPERKVTKVDGSVRAINCFQVYIRKGDIVIADECISQDFYIFYPNQSNSVLTLADLYVYDGDGIPPRYTDSPGVHKAAHFPIITKCLPCAKNGDIIPVKTIMYFGQTEIFVQTIVGNQTIIYTWPFDTDV